MKPPFLIISILIVLNLSFLLYGGFLYFGSRATGVIYITDEGFIPDEVQIPAGGTVQWLNKDVNSHWPASDFHPTHGQYSSKEGGCSESTLDACRALNKNEQYSFVFEQKGRWGIHDHLYPGKTMIVEVVDNVFLSKMSAMASIFFKKRSAGTISIKDFRKLDYQEQLRVIKKLSSENAREAWKYLKSAYMKDGQVFETGTTWLDYSHVFSHIVGNQAYQQYGMQAIILCNYSFAYGCVHGILEQALVGEGVAMIKKIEQECFQQNQACSHGLGHGLLTLEKYDVRAALRGCDILQQDQFACYNGVFMEYIWSAPKTELDENQPFAFCESFLDSAYLQACAEYQLNIFTEVFGWSFADATEECFSAPNETIRIACKEQTGMLVAHMTKGDLNRIQEYCFLLKDISNQNLCLLGAAVEVEQQQYYNWKNTVNTLCSQLPENGKYFYICFISFI